MPATIDQYLALIIDEHRDQPDFLAFLSLFLQGQVDNQNLLLSMPGRFWLATAEGWWLDQVGARIGQARQIDEPLENVYFTWGAPNLGWGQGTWFAPGDDLEGLVSLPDDAYRALLYAVVAANQWDGTVPGAYAVWDIAFGPDQILLVDNQDSTITIIWIGPNLTAVQRSLLQKGHLDLRPATVGITGYFQKSVQAAPIFGWGTGSPLLAGWGAGAWVEDVGLPQIVYVTAIIIPEVDGSHVSISVASGELIVVNIGQNGNLSGIVFLDRTTSAPYELTSVENEIEPIQGGSILAGVSVFQLADTDTGLPVTVIVNSGEFEVNP